MGPARHYAIAPQWLRACAPRPTYDYGTVAVFADLYGNLWDLVQFAA